jgi:hypothetical protein
VNGSPDGMLQIDTCLPHGVLRYVYAAEPTYRRRTVCRHGLRLQCFQCPGEAFEKLLPLSRLALTKQTFPLRKYALQPTVEHKMAGIKCKWPPMWLRVANCAPIMLAAQFAPQVLNNILHCSEMKDRYSPHL